MPATIAGAAKATAARTAIAIEVRFVSPALLSTRLTTGGDPSARGDAGAGLETASGVSASSVASSFTIFAAARARTLRFLTKARIRAMEYRHVQETDQTRQALLKAYCAIVLETPYNDFGTH